ncbi:hypothetical protein PROH_11275 [Prochlorothrix hollandica PCC 9006 = CALU 1027]|uniref:Response regulatory domain-containing protein n=2 Tax=Prochlorothrix hollandica TaxID=1223 RepID=A0A0M2Q0U3_PROHO|nr:hypothetical protein PROH_11275 [Prochlorothrix hollandica PCC 9006 = CALU 1027]
MPHLDGLQATQRLRQASGSIVQPWIIGVTAHALSGDRDRCLNGGMNDYLKKPITLAALGVAIDRYNQHCNSLETEKTL